MITFQMTSPKKAVDYQFKYDTQGRIVGFEILGENVFSSEETIALFSKVPETVGQLKQFALKHKIQLTEIIPDVTFDMFWKKYSNTAGSKVKAQLAWEKLSEKNKMLALTYINKYKQSLGATTQAYATTYINGQYWIK
jgi:hypothetical protein